MALARNLILLALAASAGLAVVAVSAHRAEPTRPVAPTPVSASKGGRVTLPAPMIAQGGRQVRSLLDVTAPMKFGDYVWDDKGVAAGAVWVRVDLGKQLISVFRGGDEIGTAVILYGADGKQTPLGEFPVLQKAVDYHSRTYDAPMPYMLRLTADGVAIHASNVRQGWATHGCVGVPMAFAKRLFAEVKPGDRVVITAS